MSAATAPLRLIRPDRHPPRHQEDHRALLAAVDLDEQARPDAIVVPSHRSHGHLDFAVELAASLGVPILILTTEAWPPEESARCLRDRPGAVLRLPKSLSTQFFGLEVARLPEVVDHLPIDTSAKRNLGLRIARALRWRSVLFLDDDVRGLDAEAVRCGLGGIRRAGLAAGGWRIKYFPDNSVVCHLRRVVELPQENFVGGGALLVELDRDVSFFPPVFNEDWLFLHDWLARGLVADLGTADQLQFDPYQPDRAAREEFGDVLAEGLLTSMGARRSGRREAGPEAAQLSEFWIGVMQARRDVHHEIMDRLLLFAARYGPESEVSSWLGSLRAILAVAHAELGRLAPESFSRFVQVWRRDRADWSQQWQAVERAPDLATALRREGVTGAYVNAGR